MENKSLLQRIAPELPSGYEISSPIKSGGQGDVFLGSFQKKQAAIKIFNPNTKIRRIDLEIDLLTSHNCENLVKILGATDFALDGIELKAVAYEYLNGEDLTQLASQDTMPSLRQLAKIGFDISKAIEFLWSLEHRIVHRDIKPGNIVVANTNRYVLVDLALARHLDLSDLTVPGRVAGTPGYMSPEQYQGRRNLTRNSDIFSLGVTLHEIATKRHPFNRDQDSLISDGVVSSLREIRHDLPSSFINLIDRMLEIRPFRRPNNIKVLFAEFLED